MAPIALPVLTDGELVLRPVRADDADAVTACCQDAEIARWIGVPCPYRREHAVEWISGAAERARAGVAVHLVAVDGDDRVVGSFSAMEIDRERGYAEIGYWVAAAARRRGIAARGVALLRDWAHAELGLTLIEILVHRDNAPSQRVAERCGFEPTGELRTAPRRPEARERSYAVSAWRAPSPA